MAFPLPHSNDKTTLDFRRFVDDNLEKGSLGAYRKSDDATRYYFPNSARDQYFADRGQLRQILSQLFPNYQGGPPPVQLADLQANYSRIFSILLWIGEGSRIREFTEHRSLADTNLPFRSKPSSFPNVTRFDTFWSDFDKGQWMFCAQDLTYIRKVEWEERIILPFARCEELGVGASGVAYRIEVHHSHDRLLSSEKAREKESRSSSRDSNAIQLKGSLDNEVWKLTTITQRLAFADFTRKLPIGALIHSL
jgi:hypothetical protein